MLTVIDFGAGNIRSIINMLNALGCSARIAESGAALQGATRLILPGVGHFDHGMMNLEERGFIGPLTEAVTESRIPLLGICLGAQLIARGSEEGARQGLGLIDADVVAFDLARLDASLRVPHMGWAETWEHAPFDAKASLPQVFSDALADDARFYYVHSFHLACDDPDIALLRACHGYEFAAGVVAGNILGLQFHPEKSHAHGKNILKAFLNWHPKG